MTPDLPEKMAVDADGFCWRVYDTHWSMCPQNPDNEAVPHPVTYYIPEARQMWRFCLGGWAGCREIYDGGHRCEKDDGHSGRCRCLCGATTTKAPPKWPLDQQERTDDSRSR